MALVDALVSSAQAQAPQGPTTSTGKVVKTDVGTGGSVFDVTEWAGRIIRMRFSGAMLFLFSQSATITTLSATETLDAASPNTTAADRCESAGWEDVTVPIPKSVGPGGETQAQSRKVYLHVYAASGTIDFRARPA